MRQTFKEKAAEILQLCMSAAEEPDPCDVVEMSAEALKLALRLHSLTRDETLDVQFFWTVEIRPKYPQCVTVHLDCWDLHGGSVLPDPVHSYNLTPWCARCVARALAAEDNQRSGDVVNAAENAIDRSRP